MVLLEFSIYPLGEGQSVSPYVARSVEIVRRSGLPYQCHAMGTTLEGGYDEVMGVARECFEAVSADCDRVECIMRLDYRKGRRGGLESKVQSVEQKLGETVRK